MGRLEVLWPTEPEPKRWDELSFWEASNSQWIHHHNGDDYTNEELYELGIKGKPTK